MAVPRHVRFCWFHHQTGLHGPETPPAPGSLGLVSVYLLVLCALWNVSVYVCVHACVCICVSSLHPKLYQQQMIVEFSLNSCLTYIQGAYFTSNFSLVRQVAALTTELVSWLPDQYAHAITESQKQFVKGFPGGSVAKNPPAKAGDTDSVPVPGWSPCHGATKPVCHNSRACAPQQKKPLRREGCVPQLRSSPCSLQLERSRSSNQDPAQPNINEKKIFFRMSTWIRWVSNFLGGKKKQFVPVILHGAYLECLVTLTSSGIQILFFCFWFLWNFANSFSLPTCRFQAGPGLPVSLSGLQDSGFPPESLPFEPHVCIQPAAPPG